MCLAMSVTPPDEFAHYRHLRALRAKIEALSETGLEDYLLVLKACDVATEDEFDVFERLAQIEPFAYVAIVEWANKVLWTHQPWPGLS
jgi:hypothetical protein